MESPRVVEFFGLPAAGKTTVSRQVAEALSTRGIGVEEPTRTIARKPAPIRIATKGRYLASATVRTPRASARITRRCLNANDRLPDPVRVAFNHHYVRGVLLRSRARENVGILDQGLYQSIWSIGLAGDISYSWLLDSLPLPAAEQPDLVVVLQVSRAALLERTRARGSADTRFAGEPDQLDRGLAGFDAIVEFLEERGSDSAPSVLVQTNETTTDRDCAVRAILEAIDP